MDDGFGHWLAGFVDGEGCFSIYRTNTRSERISWACKFILSVRDDDAAILRECVARTGVGQVHVRSAQSPTSNPQVRWQVQAKGECAALCGWLDAYPLRAKKARDYAIWRDAVWVWSNVVHRREDLNRPHWEQMARLRARLVSERAYKDFK